MQSYSFNLNKKNILITGGSGFLGTKIVDAFLTEESNVFVIDIKKTTKKKYVKYFEKDITKEKSLIKILNFFKKKKKKIDVLINNAAIDYNPKKFKKKNLNLENFSNEVWDKDILVSSVIDTDDVKNFDFSETMVKLCLERKLLDLKIKSDSGTTLTIEHDRRHIVKNNIRYEFLGDTPSCLHVFEWLRSG